MIGFYLKKSFCDGWDNLLWIVVFNLVMTSIIAGGVYLVQFLATVSVLLSFVIIFMSMIIFMIPLFMVNKGCSKIINYKSISIKETFKYIPSVLKVSLLFGLMISFLFVLGFIGIPFYVSMNNAIGFIFAAIIFWVLIIIFLSLQWFLPLYGQLDGDFFKTLKKSFILFFDNTGFSLFLFFYTIVMAFFSVFLAFLAPGCAGICMAQNNALKLRLYKYDWLEEHPELTPKESRKSIPWDELLDEDREILGPRSLKNFIFPWKE